MIFNVGFGQGRSIGIEQLVELTIGSSIRSYFKLVQVARISRQPSLVLGPSAEEHPQRRPSLQAVHDPYSGQLGIGPASAAVTVVGTGLEACILLEVPPS